jgi:serine/threonine-protein kinase RsbW
MADAIVIPTDLQEGRRQAETILRLVEDHGYSPDVCFAIRLALEEALINAIKHGNRFDPHKQIRIWAEVSDRRTAITIEDEGEGFHPDALADPTADENLEKPSGRGIMLMRAYMDQVTFNDRGNQVVMVKNRA